MNPLRRACSAPGRLGLPCDAAAVYVCTGEDGMLQWFACTKGTHLAEATMVIPLTDWFIMIDKSVTRRCQKDIAMFQIHDSPISNLFRTAFRGGGGCSIECRCGRTHFGESEGWDWALLEYENLRALAVSKPHQYVYHENYHDVSYLDIDGAPYVLDCPCETGPKVEHFLWNNRKEIAEYLGARATLEARNIAQSTFGCLTTEIAIDQLEKLSHEAHRRAETSVKALETP